MTDGLAGAPEIGTKGRRVVAGAIDWPGLDPLGRRRGRRGRGARSCRPRYLAVADRAGLAGAFEGQRTIEVVERYRGIESTDFWGIAHVTSGTEQAALPAADLERRPAAQACWAEFDRVAATVSEELRPGSRNGGCSRDEIIRHVYVSEPEQTSRKVEVRTPREVVLTPGGLATHRAAYLDAIGAYNAEGKPARTWFVEFLSPSHGVITSWTSLGVGRGPQSLMGGSSRKADSRSSDPSQSAASVAR